jgi:hypothetical protein
MQVHASNYFGNAAFAKAALIAKRAAPDRSGPFNNQGDFPHPGLWGLIRNFSPVARLA